MILHDLFFLITIGSQFLIVWLFTAQVWFPQLPPLPAAIGQGALTLMTVAFAGGLISGLLWFLLIAYPIMFSRVAQPSVDMTQALENMQNNRGVTFLIVTSPYLYMLIRLYAQIKQRQDWPSGGNDDKL